jgi:RimJ/RimL family protein N-acetyltransferase
MSLIGSERLVLAPLRGEDADRLAGLLAEPLLREWLAQDVDGLRDRFEHWESGRSPGGEAWLNWTVSLRTDDRALGWVQATVSNGCAVIAYAILPGERGRGVATEAVRALTRWLYGQPGITAVEANIAPENSASQRVAANAGFAPTDRVRAGEVVWLAARRGPLGGHAAGLPAGPPAV